jgi:sugar lactone lactonase YvrE
VKLDPQESLRVKQIATRSEVTVLAAQPGHSYGLTFTANGEYIYYTHTGPDNDKIANLYSVPSLGGSPKLVSPDVDGAVAFSPDGNQMVYRRHSWNSVKSQLIVAMSNGGDEHTIIDEKTSSTTLSPASPSWSTSRNLICVGLIEKVGAIAVYAPTGELVKTIPLPFVVNSVSWLADGSGILFVGPRNPRPICPKSGSSRIHRVKL